MCNESKDILRNDYFIYLLNFYKNEFMLYERCHAVINHNRQRCWEAISIMHEIFLKYSLYFFSDNDDSSIDFDSFHGRDIWHSVYEIRKTFIMTYDNSIWENNKNECDKKKLNDVKSACDYQRDTVIKNIDELKQITSHDILDKKLVQDIDDKYRKRFNNLLKTYICLYYIHIEMSENLEKENRSDIKEAYVEFHKMLSHLIVAKTQSKKDVKVIRRALYHLEMSCIDLEKIIYVSMMLNYSGKINTIRKTLINHRLDDICNRPIDNEKRIDNYRGDIINYINEMKQKCKIKHNSYNSKFCVSCIIKPV